MDLNKLSTEVAKFGIDFRFDGDPSNLPQAQRDLRRFRASLYLSYLKDISDYVTNVLAKPTAQGGLDGDYSFCKTGLQSPALIGDLASVFDYWVTPAVMEALDTANIKSVAGYQSYFNNRILNASDITWDTNVTAFLNSYPITKNALDQIAANFKLNIKTACERICRDRLAIQKLFSDDNQAVTLSSLKGIKSTGSDFHKGGQQVLILTFGVWWWIKPQKVPTPLQYFVPYPWWDLKLVYKPADLAVDCLLVGDSTAVNRALAPAPPFMQRSLTEIFNRRVARLNDPTMEPLPTYRILPMVTTSAQTPPPIRTAYGYIQYLSYDFGGTYLSAKNVYPFGYSDYVIFPKQNAQSIITKFYRQVGEWTAICSTFSLTDLHIENVRAHEYQPHLIDLEISLTAPMAVVEDTDLFMVQEENPIGGINGETLAGPNYWKISTSGQGLITSIQSVRGAKKQQQNRLRLFNGQLVPIDKASLIEGLKNGLEVLRACQQDDDFDPWFTRLHHVLVRLIPYATPDWTTLRQRIYELAPQGGVNIPLGTTIDESLLYKFSEEYGAYQVKRTPQPDFIVLDPSVVPGATAELTSFDIPTFYHQIDTTDILDSSGNPLTIPVNVTVQEDQPPPVQKASNIIPAGVYFAATPTTDIVKNGQVADLGGDAFDYRYGNLVWETTKALNPKPSAQNLNLIVSDK